MDRRPTSDDTPRPATDDPEFDSGIEERLPFGELAVLEEMLSRDQLNALLRKQQGRRERSKPIKLGTLLVREGLLTKRQGKRILQIQRQHGPIEGYRLLQHLGSGGMGSVFRALQESTGREVAVKILPPRATRDSRYRARFIREAELLKTLSHPNLVPCYEQGESGHHLFFAMECVPGETGRSVLKRRGAMPEGEAVAALRGVLQAMEHYWETQIIHRDIKPENIMFTPEGAARLMDLGLSRRLDDDAHITRVGKTLGTPLYISPEMAKGKQDVDVRADLYSLGATFYHLACGVPPFMAPSQADLLRAHVEDAPVPPRAKNPRLSHGFEAILLRLLEKDRADRFATPTEVLAALDRLEAGQPVATWPRRRSATPRRRHNRSSSATHAALPPRRRTELKVAPVVACVAFALLFGLGVFLGAQTSTAAPMPAGDVSSETFGRLLRHDPNAAARAALAFSGHEHSAADRIERLEAAERLLPPGAKLRGPVLRRLTALRGLLDEEASAALEMLRAELIELVDSGQMTAARERLRDFPQVYRTSTTEGAYRELVEALEGVGS